MNILATRNTLYIPLLIPYKGYLPRDTTLNIQKRVRTL
jgi:hypothetical protein